VRLQIGATGLYKGADANSGAVIRFEAVQPVRIVSTPTAGSSAGDQALAWTDGTFQVHGLCGCSTSQATLGCPSEGPGCLDVTVHLRWRASALTPAGTYSGYVKITAEVGPP
jgi:hypothetical protein